jgi:hypothetical protein
LAFFIIYKKLRADESQISSDETKSLVENTDKQKLEITSSSAENLDLQEIQTRKELPAASVAHADIDKASSEEIKEIPAAMKLLRGDKQKRVSWAQVLFADLN